MTIPHVLPGVPFGPLPVPPGVDVVVLPARVGGLTALRAAPPADRPARGTVLLVPGFTGSKEDFAPTMPLLAERGWDVWAYSQRGQADSAAPAGAGSYRLEDFASDALEVAGIVGAGQPVHLLGHSFGGLVARAAAIVAPEAFADVVLLCSGPRGWGLGRAERLRVLDERGSLGLWEKDDARLAALDPADLEPHDAFRRERAERTAVDSLRGIVEILWDPTDRTGELAATGIRCLVAHGATDAAWPQAWQREMAVVLGADCVVIPGAAHSPAQENPAGTAAALDDFWGART